MNKENVGCVCVYTDTHTHTSAIKKNEIMPFAATWMDQETQKNKYHDITYMYSLKNDTNELIYETETDLWT